MRTGQTIERELARVKTEIVQHNAEKAQEDDL